jgi:hypothetical protein
MTYGARIDRKLASSWFLVVVAIVVMGASCGCSSDMADKRAGAACTRSAQCRPGLSCQRGSCRTTPSDASMQTDAADGEDSGLEVDSGK